MGAYAPAPLFNASLRHQCMGIVQATVTAMAEEGCPYQGVLYAGTSLFSSSFLLFYVHASYDQLGFTCILLLSQLAIMKLDATANHEILLINDT